MKPTHCRWGFLKTLKTHPLFWGGRGLLFRSLHIAQNHLWICFFLRGIEAISHFWHPRLWTPPPKTVQIKLDTVVIKIYGCCLQVSLLKEALWRWLSVLSMLNGERIKELIFLDPPHPENEVFLLVLYYNGREFGCSKTSLFLYFLSFFFWKREFKKKVVEREYNKIRKNDIFPGTVVWLSNFFVVSVRFLFFMP